MKHKARLAVVVLALLLVSAVPALAAPDPFGGLSELIFSNVETWVSALIAVGALAVAAACMFGSHNSGTWARNFVIGAMFALIAGLGKAAYDLVSDWIRMQ